MRSTLAVLLLSSLVCSGCAARPGEPTCAEGLPAAVTPTPPVGGYRAVENLADLYMELVATIDQLQVVSRPVMAAGPAGTAGSSAAAAQAAQTVGSAGYEALQLLVRAGIDVAALHEALRELNLALGEIEIIMAADAPNETALREAVAAAVQASVRSTELIRAAFRSAVGFHANRSEGAARREHSSRSLRCLEARIGAHEEWSRLATEIEEVLASGEEWRSDSYLGSKEDAPPMRAPMPEPSPEPAEAMDAPSIVEERREQTLSDLFYAARQIRQGLASLETPMAAVVGMLEGTRSRNSHWRDAVRSLRDTQELCEER